MPKPIKNTDSPVSSLVLLAKRPGKTSFSSLFSVKHALGTKKVGHTGTLDSFAEGLLVVCTGGLTRIASRITAFDKEYEAIIAFGSETDTLDPYGGAVRSAPLPTVEAFADVFEAFRGELMQRPPAFSALHVDGQRASDLARKGVAVDVPERKITVFDSSIKEIREKDGFVEFAHVVFHVSKGTYIRSLARDIAASCGSAAHLVGLLRTKVGSFRLEDAAGYALLKPFSIERVVSGLKSDREAETGAGGCERTADYGEIRGSTRGNDAASCVAHGGTRGNGESVEADEQAVQAEIRQKMRSMTPEVASECGFTPLFLKEGYVDWFFHGKPLSGRIFWQFPADGTEYAVFYGNTETASGRSAVVVSAAQSGGNAQSTEKPIFAGIIERNGRSLKYGFVMSNS
ncbi:MAG: tRNA pseudouridine(55) synthase TruB [Treponemataceae bacterium]|nr:tRNA pseudouridine(55) synthase TruB [Treponemataceae bacterium]